MLDPLSSDHSIRFLKQKEVATMCKSFLQDESGAQVVEYALIIAVISIALVLALQPLSIAASFGSFIDRVTACLSGGDCA